MSVKAFKYYTIQAGGTPQPLIGSHLTVAVTPGMVAAGKTVGGNFNQVLLTVADSSMFVGGQWMNIIDPGTYVTERVEVINCPSATTVNVQGVRFAHPGGAYGTGSWVAVGDHAQNVYVQALDGNAGALYVGTSPLMVKATGVFVIVKLQLVAAGTQPYDFGTSRQGLADTEPTSQYWIDGTTGDSYLPSLGLV
jgi:hypothetical protein